VRRSDELPRKTPIAQVMTTKLSTADVHDTIETVRKLLLEGSFHHVPILEGSKLVGIISSRDLVRFYQGARSGEDEARSPDVATRAEHLMQTDLVTMRSDESVERAIDLLADGEIHSVLVLDAEDALVGISTNIDLLEYLFA
jgi:CBS domain-containing protein